MGSWVGITLIEVGGASACGGLKAEGLEYFTAYLRFLTKKGGFITVLSVLGTLLEEHKD